MGRMLYDVPDSLCRNPWSQDPASAAHLAKNTAFADASRDQPFTQLTPDPIRNRHGPYVAPFANQVHDRPVFLALLDVGQFELDRFMAPQSAGQHQSKQRAVTLALHPL